MANSSERLYSVWQNMKRRCDSPGSASYKYYGQRGISVCREWYESYEIFRSWALSTGYDPEAPKGKCTLDRIDNDGNYCPENCRWVDMAVQGKNKRKYSRKYQMVPVEQIDESGNVLAWYPSMLDAEKQTGMPSHSIGHVCRGRQNSTYGTLWRYAEKDKRDKYEKPK